MNTEMDPVDQRQRQHARRLGLIIGGGFVAVVVICIIIFSTYGLPKDPKEWKRLQEQRAAIGTESAVQPQQKDPTK